MELRPDSQGNHNPESAQNATHFLLSNGTTNLGRGQEILPILDEMRYQLIRAH
jgi:hypothetical protein